MLRPDSGLGPTGWPSDEQEGSASAAAVPVRGYSAFKPLVPVCGISASCLPVLAFGLESGNDRESVSNLRTVLLDGINQGQQPMNGRSFKIVILLNAAGGVATLNNVSQNHRACIPTEAPKQCGDLFRFGCKLFPKVGSPSVAGIGGGLRSSGRLPDKYRLLEIRQRSGQGTPFPSGGVVE